ncbi:hypothetical protein KCMC57_up16810 [Kitasatospora sp. CMC57]|uniref:Polyketide cyclase n=1 Tax=Kitasatospora sp. CMC57 TaxID=3231513 RepID=A0AB33JTF7_9ACTN
MLHAFDESATIAGDLDAIWRTVSDVAGWSTWDPHVLESGTDTPFEVGGGGWTISRIVKGRRSYFKLVEVDPGRGYTTESPMPLGKMLIINRYEQAGPGLVKLSRRVEVHGGFAPVYGFFWAKAFQADTRATFEELGREIKLRATRVETSR